MKKKVFTGSLSLPEMKCKPPPPLKGEEFGEEM